MLEVWGGHFQFFWSASHWLGTLKSFQLHQCLHSSPIRGTYWDLRHTKAVMYEQTLPREHTKNFMREILSTSFIKLIELSMLYCPSTSWWLRDWGLTRVSVRVSPLSWVSRADYTFLSNHSSFLSPSFKPFSPPFHITLIFSLLLLQFLAVFVRMCSRKAARCVSEGNQTFLPRPNTKGQSHSPNCSMFVYCLCVPVTGRINPWRT